MIRFLRSSQKLTKSVQFSPSVHLPVLFTNSSNDRSLSQFSTRNYSLTTRKENPLIIGGVGFLVVAGSLHVGMKLYNQYQQNKSATPPPTPEEQTTTTSSTATDNSQTTVNETTTKSSKANKEEKVNSEKTEENAEASPGFFSNFFATTYYDGGFEDKMTKREAALILGVRESATVERIKDAHRRILIINHPDRGGSPYIAAKVNEAKDFLLKGKVEK